MARLCGRTESFGSLYVHLLTLDISTIRRDGPEVECIAAALPALQTTAPILQVARCNADTQILVRTWTTTFVGRVMALAPDDTGPRFVVRVLAHVHTGAAVPTRQVDALATQDSQAHLVDAHGTLRVWDFAAQKPYVRCLTQSRMYAASSRRVGSHLDACGHGRSVRLGSLVLDPDGRRPSCPETCCGGEHVAFRRGTPASEDHVDLLAVAIV